VSAETLKLTANTDKEKKAFGDAEVRVAGRFESHHYQTEVNKSSRLFRISLDDS